MVTRTCDPSYGFIRDVEQVCSDGDIANSKNGTGSVDALLDEIGMPSGVLLDGTVHELGLSGVGERGKVADSLLGLWADLYRGLVDAHSSFSWYLKVQST